MEREPVCSRVLDERGANALALVRGAHGATTDRFLKERPETARKFLHAFVAGIHVWMTDEKTTKQILAKRLKIADKEILDATYLAYKKLTEKKLIRR